MSLILEALKKSERQRQIGTAPTLATPPMSRKRKRSLLPWLVAAIAVAAVAGWWLSRNDTPDSAPPSDIQNPLPAPAAAPVAATATKPEVPMTTVAPPPAVNIEPNVAPAPVLVSPEKQMAEAAAAIAAAAPPAPAPAPSAQPPAVTTAPAPAVVVPATPPAGENTPVPPPVVAPATPPPSAAAIPSPSSTASLPLLWELPYEKRKDIPALVMSLQVYALDPAQRFAIINEERHVEGDDLGDGLKLQEITPDGLIVEYGGERFLFPRGGR